MSGPAETVKTRRVFYIPGYDPHPPQRYRKLYEAEGPKQADLSGYRISVSATKGTANAWEATARIDGHETHAAIEVLEWTDIVRDTMDRSLAGSYLQLLHVAWVYLSTGALRRLMWLRKGPILAGFYPVLMLLGQLLVAMLAGKLAAVLATGALAFILRASGGMIGGDPTGTTAWQIVDVALGWAIFAATVLVVLRWAKRQDARLFAHYLMHDLAFTVRHGGAYPPELDARIEAFKMEIAAALASPVDEVLVVGHSSGAQLAVSAVADLLRDDLLPLNGPALSLLTLGQSIPMISFLPKATDLRRDLHDLAVEDRITWVDISAPGDGCSFALCDPVAVTGVAPENQRWPLVLSAAFSQTLRPETLAALKHRYFRLHFQYLCAFDRPGEYDYFKITAGPASLGQRFAHRKPSMNRIDVPASRFRTMAA